MVNIEALIKKIDDSGMTNAFICKKADIDTRTFYNRLHRKGDFRAEEIMNLCNVLHLSKKERDEIFFVKNVTNSNAAKEPT
mgnify:CR=1 FL=1